MAAMLTCPQCQAALQVNQPLGANQLVTCPHCRLKFVPPAASAAAPAASGGMLPWLLVAIVAGLGVGGFAWNKLANPKDDGAKNDGGPDNKPAVVAQTLPNQNVPTQTLPNQNVPTQNVPNGQQPANGQLQAPAKQTTEPAPSGLPSKAPPSKPPMGNGDEPPDPQPMIKKPPPKTETKQPPEIAVPPVGEKKPPAVEDKAAPPTVAAKPPATHPKQAQINAAIDRGVEFLKGLQLASGSWPRGQATGPEEQFGFDVGYAALAGLTLLECRMPADNPAVQRAADFVRSTPVHDRLRRTYQLSTAILFLDRLGDPKDRDLIQAYALELAAGQNGRGGWNYDCPRLSRVEMQHLLAFLQATRFAAIELPDPLNPLKLNDPLKGAVPQGLNTKPPAPRPAQKKAGAKAAPPVPAFQSLPSAVARLPIVQNYYNPGAPLAGTIADNSNTQFALLALWAARRHGIAAERVLAFAGQRFAFSQNPDRGWSYWESGGVDVPSTPTMTCVGLLGLAMAKASAPAHAQAPAKAAPLGKLPEIPAIASGLQKLGEHVDGASMRNFYLLWSVERVGVLYDIKTIGGRDWYDIGVDLLLPSQDQEGGWRSQGYPGSTATIDTCFALLFLRRSNLVQDLTDRLPLLMSIPDRTPRPNR